MNLFPIAANDQSVSYLAQIFGIVGNLLPVPAGGAPLLLGVMFKVLNSMALTVGAFIVVYVLVVGLLKTAQEGEFLGKNWNSLWVPVRTVFGIASLFPTATGYSAIQVVMMWIILQGVGAADAMWTAVLKYVMVAGSPSATIPFTPTVDGNASTMQLFMSTLFKTLTCQATTLRADKDTFGDDKTPIFYCGDSARSGDSFCSYSQNPSTLLNISSGPQVQGGAYRMGPSGTACGTLTYACSDSSYCTKKYSGLNDTFKLQLCNAACGAQKTALQNIVLLFGSIAGEFAKADQQYLKFCTTQAGSPGYTTPDWINSFCGSTGKDQCAIYNENASPGSTQGSQTEPVPQSCGKPLNTFPSYLVSGTPNYASPSMEAVSDTYIPFYMAEFLTGGSTGSTLGSGGSDFVNMAANYYQQAIAGSVVNLITGQGNVPITDITMKTIQANGWILAGGYYYVLAAMTNSNLGAASPWLDVVLNGSLPNYRNNVAAADVLIMGSQPGKSSKAAAMPEQLSQASQITDAVEQTKNGSVKTFIDMVNAKSGDPLASLNSFGESLIIGAYVIFGVSIVISTVIAVLASLNVMVLGSGLTQNPVLAGFQAVMSYLTPALFALMACFITFGGLLAVYVPLIPYIIFALGAVGWLIAVIEAMVAAPIVALGILAPGGQHEILGRAEGALMMTFSIFLRPSLMVLGMMISMLLAIVAMKFINAGFGGVVTNMLGGTPGLVEFILVIAAYSFLVITVLNKCFSLIYHLPDTVLSWLGHQGRGYGEAEGLAGVKGGVEAAGSGTAGAAKGTTDAAGGAAREKQGAEDKRRTAAEEKNAKNNPEAK